MASSTTPTEHQRIRDAAAGSSELLWADNLGVSDEAMARMSDEGTLTRLAPGVYASPDAPLDTLSEAAAWSVRFPNAVVCGLTAAVHHELTTAWERGTWLAVETGTSLPRSRVFPVNAVQVAAQWLDPSLDDENDIERRNVLGCELRVTGLDRTVLDLWRLQRRIAYEHAVEALRLRVAMPDFSVPRFAKLAQRLRVWPRVGPILEGMMLR